MDQRKKYPIPYLTRLQEWDIQTKQTTRPSVTDSNMENLNAVFIEQNMTQRERLVKLNQIAIHQMSILESNDNQNRKLLK